MPLTEDTNACRYHITGYKPGEITINDETHTSSLIVTNDTLITDWAEDIDRILALNAEIILLGTGRRFKRPPPEWRQFDCMNTGAACRTFIALTSEGRNVVAALLID